MVDLDELENVENSPELLSKLWTAVSQFYKDYACLFQNYRIDFLASVSTLSGFRTIIISLNKDIKALHKNYRSISISLLIKRNVKRQSSFLEDCLQRLEELKNP